MKLRATYIVPLAVHRVLVSVRVCNVFVELNCTIDVCVPRSLAVLAVTVLTSVAVHVFVAVGMMTSVVVVSQLSLAAWGRPYPRPASSGSRANESISFRAIIGGGGEATRLHHAARFLRV